MPKVTVISPIYKVESFVAKCAESLMRQTLEDVEFIFVDDCTPDNSINVLKGILDKNPDRNARILTHEVNKGLPAARNTGLEAATGEYVFHCDGDDFVEPTMLEELYETARETNSEFVWCDYYESFPDKEIYKKEPAFYTPEACTKGMLSRHMQYNVWNKLVKQSLYDRFEISFPDGRSMGEDLTMIKLASVASSVSYLPKAFYHYVRWNSQAMTQSFTEKKLGELKQNIGDLSEFLHKQHGEEFTAEICHLMLWSKFRFLLTNGSKGEYGLFDTWFPESNVGIWELPNANFRIKALFWCASKGLFWVVKIHYYLVLKLVYSIIHR